MKYVKMLLPALIMFAIGALAGWGWGQDTDPDPPTRTEVVDVSEYERRIEALTVANEGLQGRVRRLRARAPRVVTRTDTLVVREAPEVAVTAIKMDAGNLLMERIRLLDSIPGIRYSAQLEETTVGDCERWWLSDAGIVCDRNWLGRFGVVGRVLGSTGIPGDPPAFGGEVGVWFQRAPNSAWTAEINLSTDLRATLAIEWRRKILSF